MLFLRGSVKAKCWWPTLGFFIPQKTPHKSKTTIKTLFDLQLLVVLTYHHVFEGSYTMKTLFDLQLLVVLTYHHVVRVHIYIICLYSSS